MNIKTTVDLTPDEVTHAIANYLRARGILAGDIEIDVDYRFVKINNEDILTTTVYILQMQKPSAA